MNNLIIELKVNEDRQSTGEAQNRTAAFMPGVQLNSAKQVDETKVLTGLTLDRTSSTVALGNGLLEATLISRDHQKSDASAWPAPKIMFLMKPR